MASSHNTVDFAQIPIMLLRPIVCCLIFIAGNACNSINEKAAPSPSRQELSISSSNIVDVDKNFDSFIERFSKDAAFQMHRTKFPLKIKQYNPENDTNSIIYRQESAFTRMNFCQRKSETGYVPCNQEIVLDNAANKARIEIRGIENGISVDYYFEKKDGKWLLVGVDDSST